MWARIRITAFIVLLQIKADVAINSSKEVPVDNGNLIEEKGLNSLNRLSKLSTISIIPTVNDISYLVINQLVTVILVKGFIVPEAFLKDLHSRFQVIVLNEMCGSLSGQEQYLEQQPLSVSEPGTVILYAKDYHFVEEIMVNTTSKRCWQAFQEFILIFTGITDNPEEIHQIVSEINWPSGIFKVTILHQHICNKTSHLKYGGRNVCTTTTMYIPLLRNKIASTFPEVSNGMHSVIKTFGVVDMHGINLKIVAVKEVQPLIETIRMKNRRLIFRGALGMVFTTLTEYMNISSILTSIQKSGNCGSMRRNGSWSHILGKLQSGEADFALCAVTNTPERNRYFRMTTPVLVETYAAVVNKAKEIPRWKTIYLPFTPLIWQLTFYVLILSGIVIIIYNYTTRRPLNLITLFLHLLGIFLQISVKHPRKPFVRFIFLLWALFGLIIISGYQGFILSFLTIPRCYPELNTLEDIADTVVNILAAKPHIKVMNSTINPYLRKILTTAVTWRNLNLELPLVLQTDTFAIFGRKYVLEFNLKALECGKCGKQYHFIDEKVGIMITSLCASERFPFINQVNTFIRSVRESGLIDKWLKDSLDVCHKICISERNVVLAIEHVIPCFIVLPCGSLIAILSCIMEVIFHKIKRREQTALKLK